MEGRSKTSRQGGSAILDCLGDHKRRYARLGHDAMKTRRSITTRRHVRRAGPWAAEETDDCFIVRDVTGQALAYVYFE